ncbi:MAG: histidine ammonia-lyase, partial [Candidatus Bathyarchaeia archaeon]
GRVASGVTRGVGPLNTRIISTAKAREFQTNLIRSHTVGVGEPLPAEVVRACMLLRANTLARGMSGVRLKTLLTLIDMLNMDVRPLVPRVGALGAGADVISLAHIASAIIGEGQVMYGGILTDGKSAMQKAGIPTVELSFKEGLALMNGPSLAVALAALAVFDATNLMKTADIAAAMSLEARGGITEPLDEKIHTAKPHRGQIATARNIQRLIEGSKLVTTLADARSKLEATHKPHEMTEATRESDVHIEDPHAFRCIPQVVGAARDALAFARGVVETEVNSTSDNPLILPTGEILPSGNFHAEHVALAMDTLCIALTLVGNMVESRMARLLSSSVFGGLPRFLMEDQTQPTLGFVGLQNSTAALAAENRILSTPASVHHVPMVTENQDAVSMGTLAANKVLRVLANMEHLLAMELICAAQGVELRRPGMMGKGTAIAFRVVRSWVSFLSQDRPLHTDVERLTRSVHSGAIVTKVEEIISRLE